MSLLDKISDTLNPALWGPGDVMLPHVKMEIIKKLTSLIPEKMLKQIWLIGSNASLQYNDFSDVDASVQIDIPKGKEYKDELYEWHKAFKTHNETNDFLTGTKHPINYFAMPSNPISWGEETTSVYLIKDFDTDTEDRWFRAYKKGSEIRNPNDKYDLDLMYAKMVGKVVKVKIDELMKDIKDLKNIDPSRYQSKLREIDEDLKQVISEISDVEKDRKFAYGFGWGVPKYGNKNLVYKVLEREGLLTLLDKLKAVSP